MEPQLPTATERNADEDRVCEAVFRIGGELLTGLDELDVLTRLCAHTVEEVQCEASHVFLWNEERQSFVAAAHVGERADLWGLAQLADIAADALGELRQRLESGEPTAVRFDPDGERARLDDDDAQSADLGMSPLLIALIAGAGWQRCLLAGIRQGGRLIGFQTACRRAGGAPFSAVEVSLAHRFSCLAAFAARYVSLTRALIEANGLQSRFVANMSHELRTPLNVIIGYNALLLEGEFGPVEEEQRDILARIARRARELAEAVTSTLEVGKLDAGQMAFDVRLVDVPVLLAEVEEDARVLPTSPSVNVRWHREGPLPPLLADPAKLRVVLGNLIANAAKFTESGEINVLARATAEAVQFVVSDTGRGIAPDMLPLIFEPFRKGGDPALAQPPGIGLGLYIVRRLVEGMNGEVSVESRLHQGSRFVVELPLRRGIAEE